MWIKLSQILGINSHYKVKQEIVSSLCYLVSIQTEHCMCACVLLYHVIILNTRTLRVTIIKGKFDLKLNSKGSRGPYRDACFKNHKFWNIIDVENQYVLMLCLTLNKATICVKYQSLLPFSKLKSNLNAIFKAKAEVNDHFLVE